MKHPCAIRAGYTGAGSDNNQCVKIDQVQLYKRVRYLIAYSFVFPLRVKFKVAFKKHTLGIYLTKT